MFHLNAHWCVSTNTVQLGLQQSGAEFLSENKNSLLLLLLCPALLSSPYLELVAFVSLLQAVVKVCATSYQRVSLLGSLLSSLP